MVKAQSGDDIRSVLFVCLIDFYMFLVNTFTVLLLSSLLIITQLMYTICKGTELVNNDRFMIAVIRADSPVFNQIHFSCSVRSLLLFFSEICPNSTLIVSLSFYELVNDRYSLAYRKRTKLLITPIESEAIIVWIQ